MIETATYGNHEHDTLRPPEQGTAVPGAFSPLTEWMGMGVVLALLAWALIGIWMVLAHGVPLPLEAICLRG